MCGRMFNNFSDEDVLNDESFEITKVLTHFEPRQNVFPGTFIPVVVPGSRILDTYKWGLIPSWAKDKAIGFKLINARAETVYEKPSFRSSFKDKRCLVLSSGFYEWDSYKIPHLISIKDKKIIAFAGLFSEWTNKETGDTIKTCTIVTCAANKFMSKIHARMPVILEPENYEKWLFGTIEEAKELIVSKDNEQMQEKIVSKESLSFKEQVKEFIETKKRKGIQKKLF